MSEAASLIERYDLEGHEVADFAFGEESLDRWLHRYAGQGEQRDATRTLHRRSLYAVVVHAINSAAVGFGFRSLSEAPRNLMVTLAELKEAGYGR